MSGSNVAAIIDFFRGKGLSDVAIAGILGNMRQESDFNTGAYNAGEGAIGLGQWEGGRRTALQNFAAAHGMQETDLDAQLGYYWHELQTSFSGVLNQLRTVSSASEAANIVNRQYEISGDYTNARETYASQYLSTNFHGISAQNVGNSGGGPDGSAGDGGGGNVSNTAADYKAQLGDLGQALSQIPDLNKILQKALDGDWTIDKFINAVDNSDWYKNHSATARSIIAQRISDPASYQQSLQQTEMSVSTLAGQEGWDLSKAQLQAIAQHALLTGNESNQQFLTEAIGNRQHYGQLNSTSGLQGGMAATVQQLQNLAGQYGVQNSAQVLAHRAKTILMGDQTLDTYRQDYMNTAKSMFPGLADQIDKGRTVADIADPYVQSMSGLLELDPSSVDVRTPLIRKALQGMQSVTDGKHTIPAVQPLWSFEDAVRNDARYQYTDGAHQQTASLLTQLGSQWGFE